MAYGAYIASVKMLYSQCFTNAKHAGNNDFSRQYVPHTMSAVPRKVVAGQTKWLSLVCKCLLSS